MDNQQIANLLRIQQASRTNKLVVFVGAGVSQNSGIPTWNNLISSMMDELPSELSKESDVLKLAQMYKDSRGHKEYMDKIKNVLLYNKAVPNPLHKSIIALNPCHIITTNYDDLVEQELANEFKQYDIIREDKDIPQMENQHCLVKMHGDYATDNIVLTEKDYFDYKNNFPLIRAFVQSLFASKLVLFVGFSFADLNLKMIMNELQNILSENMQRAYLLSYDKPNDITKKYFEEKGINILHFSEKELDYINDAAYSSNILSGIGLYTDKALHAIINYCATSKKDLAQYLYVRILPYLSELKSFGDGLKYFFPEYENMSWNTHSEGLQTGLKYFIDLGEKLNTNVSKRNFLIKHPTINIRELLKIAYYNYLYEIDGLEIIDNNYLQNVNKYIGCPTLYYIHRFASAEVSNKLKRLRTRQTTYTIEDLELPYALYMLGDYKEAYRIYANLLPLYWERQKYILYFICRYNLWSIRYGVYFQLVLSNEYNVNKEIELATSESLDTILGNLPLDAEIKKIFRDLISFRSIGSHAISTEQLREEIYQQRKSAEKGGCSINSNIVRLMSLYERESMFSWANYIICDNNGYFKSICENNAIGILNSFATPSATMFGGFGHCTKITALDENMLESLIFTIDNKRLKAIFKGYEIRSLKFDNNGIEYINSCLSGLIKEQKQVFRETDRLYNPLNNLLLLLSKSKEEKINKDDLYKMIIKYQSQNRTLQFDNIIIEDILSNYSPDEVSAKTLLWNLICTTSDYQEYAQCIYNIVKVLHDANITYDEFEYRQLQNKENIATEISFLYSIVTGELRNEIREFSLSNIGNLHDFIYFIKHNEIEKFPVERFEVLLEKDKNKLRDVTLFLLAEIRKDSRYKQLNGYIDELAKENNCLQFFLSPLDYPEPKEVNINWLLDFDEEIGAKLFKNNIYKEKLKCFIMEGHASQNYKKHLMQYL